MANSSSVSSGQQATAAQHNALRDDILSTTSGHIHDGSNGRIHESFTIEAGEGDAAAFYMKADQGDDAGDEWKVNVADGGVMTIRNDIASAGTYVTHLTLTPHATITSSSVTIPGILDVNGSVDWDVSDVQVDSSGDIDLVSTNNSAGSIYLRENASGGSGTVKIHADQGTSVTEGAESINILSDAGGVGIRSTANLAKAINLTSDGGTTGSISIFNDQGTSVTEGAESIALLSDAGGIGIRSTANLANAVNITVDGGTTSSITLFNDQGSGTASIKLLSDAGGITFTAGVDIELDATDDVNIPADVGLTFGNDAEKIEGDGTDLTIAGNNINLTATADVVIPANVGVTFGSGEKIEGDSTDLTVTSGAKINLTATSDVVIPANVGITFGSGEKIEGDSTDLTVTSGAKLNLTATSDVHIPKNVGIVFDDNASEKIESNDTNLTINSGADINLTATSDVNIPTDVGITFGDDGEKIEGDGTDLTISGNIINLSGTVATTGTIELGHASDTTLTRSGSGDVTIEGNAIYRADGTDVPVADGGTGASSLTDGGVLLGSGTSAVTAMAVLADSEMIVGDGTTDPVAESGATLRTSIGVGTGDSPQFTAIELGHASDTTIARSGSGAITVEGTQVLLAGAQTGVTTITNASLVVGRDADNDIDFTTDNNIRFRAGGEDQLTLTDGALTPSSNAIVDLGTDALEFKDAWFDGTVTSDAFAGPLTGNVTGTADVATVATTVTITDNESTNENNAIIFTAGGDVDGGNIGLESDGTLTYNPSTGKVTATGFIGALTGDVTGDVTGTADTATVGTSVTASANNSTDETVYPTFVDGVTGTQGIETDTGLTYNPSSGILTSTQFTGALSGNAATATALATGRTIGGTSFDGTANIAVALSATTTALASARTIGGTSFDGTGNIAVALSTLATTVTITDNESTNEENAVIFTAGGDVDGGNLGLESDGNLTYNPSTGTVTATIFKGNINAVDGDFDGTTNLDAVDIDGAVQIDAAVTIGVDGTGYDLMARGDTVGSYMHWDESEDDFILKGANLVIGHTAPVLPAGATPVFQQIGSSQNESSWGITRYSENANAPQIFITKSRSNTIGANVTPLNNDGAGSIHWMSGNNTAGQDSLATESAVIRVDHKANAGNGVSTTDMAFHTSNAASAAVAFTLHANKDATLVGSLTCVGVTETSDVALKTNINTIDSALNKVNQMRGVSYDRIDTNISSTGLIAQELEKIAPELVQDNEEYKSVSYTKLTAYLVEAIKELSNKVKDLEAK